MFTVIGAEGAGGSEGGVVGIVSSGPLNRVETVQRCILVEQCSIEGLKLYRRGVS